MAKVQLQWVPDFDKASHECNEALKALEGAQALFAYSSNMHTAISVFASVVIDFENLNGNIVSWMFYEEFREQAALFYNETNEQVLRQMLIEMCGYCNKTRTEITLDIFVDDPKFAMILKLDDRIRNHPNPVGGY